MNPRSIAATLTALAIPAVALASGPTETTAETFTNASNLDGWSYFGDPNNNNEVILEESGNPAWWLSTTCEGLNCLDTTAPHLRTNLGTPSPFIGDYRAQEVISVGVDVRMDFVAFSADVRPLSVILRSDNNTPADPDDDFWLFAKSSEFVPTPGEGWKEFEFDLPVDSATLPAGWGVLRFGPGSPADDDDAWNSGIQSVDQLGFMMGEPDLVYIFQQFQVGADNPRIVKRIFCPADFDGCGSVDSQDLAILLGEWGATNSVADITNDGVVNSEDLAALLGDWGSCQ